MDLEYSGLDLTAAYNNGASILVKGRVRNSARPMTKPSILRQVQGNNGASILVKGRVGNSAHMAKPSHVLVKGKIFCI